MHPPLRPNKYEEATHLNSAIVTTFVCLLRELCELCELLLAAVIPKRTNKYQKYLTGTKMYQKVTKITKKHQNLAENTKSNINYKTKKALG